MNWFSGEELKDHASLAECNVESGATLKLVLALRGGPINTRRVPLPSNNNSNQQGQNQANLQSDLQQIMMKNKDKIMDKMPPNGQVF